MYWNIYLANDTDHWENLTPTKGMDRMRALQIRLPHLAHELEAAARGLFAGEKTCWNIGDDVYVELRDEPGRYVDGMFHRDVERMRRDGMDV